MSRIQRVRALQILDSRGVPTLRVFVETDKGVGVASVPSGASTGQHEACELRDSDAKLYLGKGVLTALKHVEGPLAQAIKGMDVMDQLAIDEKMKELDASANKSNLGANAILGISMAVARAAAMSRGIPLYQHLYDLMPGSHSPATSWILPCPMLNIINGGAHADNTIDAQEFMIRPIGSSSFSEALRWSSEIYMHLKKILKNRKLSTAVGDEGGFAPLLDHDEQALDLIVEAIQVAGYTPGKQITLALDTAASEFFDQGIYSDKKKLARGLPGTQRSSIEQVDLLESWTRSYPIDSIEDGLAENDWDGFVALNQRLGASCQIVGDDLLVTNSEFVRRAIQKKAVNAVLVKLNQIGTVSETLETIDLSHRAGLKTIISHRSGETEDAFIADLAVGCGSGQIKTGSTCRSERIAKYNRLLEIESELGPKAVWGKR